MACRNCGKSTFARVCFDCRDRRFCVDCKREVSSEAVRCFKCSNQLQKKNKKPLPRCVDCGGERSARSSERCMKCSHKRAAELREIERRAASERQRREWLAQRKPKVHSEPVKRSIWTPEKMDKSNTSFYTEVLIGCGLLRQGKKKAA